MHRLHTIAFATSIAACSASPTPSSRAPQSPASAAPAATSQDPILNESQQLCSASKSTAPDAVRVVLIRGATSADACNPVAFQAGEPYDAGKVEAATKALLATGLYDQATATRRKTDLGISLVFTLVERRQPARTEAPSAKVAVVSAITFRGLALAKEGALRKVVILDKGQPATKDAIDQDVLAISLTLYDLGLMESHVEPQITAGPDPDSVTVAFVVEEGRVFHVGKVSIEGEGKLRPTEYARVLARFKKGAAFDQSLVRKSLEELLAIHAKTGAAREIEPETAVDPQQSTVDIIFHVR